MTLPTRHDWLDGLVRFLTARGGKGTAPKPHQARLELEHLEVRLAPATHIWTGAGGNANWGASNNWIGGAPTATETGANAAVLYFPSNAKTFASNDNIANLTIGGINFTGDITGGTYTGANLLAAAGTPANTGSPYNIGVAGAVTALPFSNTTATTGTTAGNGTTLVAGFGAATIGQLVKSTDTIGGPVTFQATGTATFNDNPGGGATANKLVVGGKITESHPAIVGAVVVNNGASAFGVVQFSGINTYTGGATIAAGVLLITNSGALGKPTGNNFTAIQDDARLQLSGNLTIATGAPIQIGNGSGGFGDIADVSGNSSINDTIVFDDGNPPVASASEIDVNNAANTLTLNGVMTGASTGGATGGGAGAGLFKSGPGALVLPATAANTYDGSTSIFAGAVSIANPRSLGSPTAPRTTFVHSGAKLKIQGNFSVGAGAAANENFESDGGAIESVSGTPTINGALMLGQLGVVNATSTIQTDAGSTLTISGIISDTAGSNPLTKTGTGKLVLNANNTYRGVTTISSGTLLINGNQSSATGSVAVNGVLGGIGALGGAVTVNRGGAITGGTLGGIGTLTVGSLTFNGGAFAADFSGNTSDTIVTTGAVNLNGGTAGIFTIHSQAGAVTLGHVFTLIDNTGAAAIANPPLTRAPEGGDVGLEGAVGQFTYSGGNGKSFIVTAKA